MAAQQVQPCKGEALDQAISLGVVACYIKGECAVPDVFPES